MDRAARAALATLALLVLVTAAWWALALWPAPGETPAWLARTRAVCFAADESGLPGPAGWMVLVGQPLGMLGLLLAGWRGALRRGLGALAASWRGRTVLATWCVLVAGGFALAGVRVARAQGPEDGVFFTHELPPPTYPRLDRPAPGHGLVDQRGETVSMARLRGRPVLVTFAFGHCETVCPLAVQQVLSARETLEEEMDPAVVVVTLDPWRDTPARLPHLARQWGLDAPWGYLLGGSVEEVEAALDAWGIARSRNPLTGDVAHPALVYVVDRQGRITYGVSGSPRVIVELARRL